MLDSVIQQDQTTDTSAVANNENYVKVTDDQSQNAIEPDAPVQTDTGSSTGASGQDSISTNNTDTSQTSTPEPSSQEVLSRRVLEIQSSNLTPGELTKLLVDDNPVIRLAAIVKGHGDKRTIEESHINIAIGDEDPRVRIFLSQYRLPVKHLLTLLQDPVPMVRINAANHFLSEALSEVTRISVVGK